METTQRTFIHGALAAGLALTLAPAAKGGMDMDGGDGGTNLQALVTAALNPVAKMMKVPFQNDFDFGVGPNQVTQYTLNIEPIVPFTLNEDWNLITRTVIPIISQPSAGSGMAGMAGKPGGRAVVFSTAGFNFTKLRLFGKSNVSSPEFKSSRFTGSGRLEAVTSTRRQFVPAV